MHTVYLLCTKRQIWKLILKTSRLRLFRAIFSKVFVACNWFASYRQNVWKYVNVPENCSLSKVYRSMLQLFCIFFRSAADSADLSAICGDVGHQTGSCQCVALRTDFKFPPPPHMGLPVNNYSWPTKPQQIICLAEELTREVGPGGGDRVPHSLTRWLLILN